MKRCAIVSGGEKSCFEDISKCDFIIACDKGFQYCVEENIKPDLIVGDFDSLDLKLPEDVTVIRLQVRKDDTDTMSAIRYSIEKGFDEIYLYCALGKRLDHAYANIQSCVYASKHNVDCIIFDDKNKIYITNKNNVVIHKENTNNISLFAVDEVKGLSIKGSDYDCDNVTLTNSYPLGQSNHFIKNEINILKDSGILIIICSLGI